MHDKSQIRKHLISQSASGLTGTAYCRREDLNVWTFRNWCKRRAEYLASPAAPDLPFIKLSLPSNDSATAGSPSVLKLRLGDSVALTIPAEFDVTRLGAILRTLKRSHVLG